MKSVKRNLLIGTLLSSAMLVSAAPSFAQDASDDEVIVTGSRLNVNPNLISASPVLTVGDEEISAQGAVNIEDLTNNLPQVFAGQAGEVSNGASGTANLNLRGLGAVRTLTMIDGRRLPYGSSTSSAVNLDLVPTNLVERVEILTGGASAVYGSDAVGGVANFILKDDFEGAELDLQYGFAQNSNGIDLYDEVLVANGVDVPGSSTDGEEFNASITLGANTADGKGNVTMFASYQNREQITQDNRSFSACTLGSGDTNGFGCVGSANFRLFGGPGGFNFQEEDGTLVPYAGGSDQTFNFGPFNFFQRPAERVQIFTKGQYEIFDGHEVFGSASYTNNFSDAQVAPSASFGIGAYSINCDNPFIQNNPGNSFLDVFGCTDADVAAGNDVSGVTLSHRNVEGGPRNSRLENSAFRLVGGLRGNVAEIWNYELFGQFSRTTDQSISTNDFVIANLQDSLFAVDDGEGNVVCRSGNAGCVPYNIFQRGADGSSMVTSDQTDFIQGIGIVNGDTEQVVFGGTAQANLGDYGFKSPYSDSGVGLLIGYENRTDSLDSRPDEISQVPGGGFTGVGGATLPVKGEVKSSEFFAEVQVPLLTDMPFAKELVVSGAYRHSKYDTDGNDIQNSFNTDAYGVTASWAPVEDFSLRGQYQRSVRAPNVIELFTGQDVGLPNLNAGENSLGETIYDPCATSAPTASAAACAFTGVTAAQYGNILDVISGQTQGITGGNPGLTPEKSDTFTLGGIFTPSSVPGLSLSVDYFDITVEDFIAAGIGAQTTLTECLATGNAAFCDLIQRDSTGSLNSGTAGVGFTLTNLNIAELATAGVDLQAGYSFDLADIGVNNAGDLKLQYAATILDKFAYTPFPGGEAIECSGKYGNDCAQPVNPKYRHRVMATWASPFGVETRLTWRHYSGVDNIAADPAEIDQTLSAQNYFDLSGNYEIVEGVKFRAGVNNLFLEQPPVSISSGPPLGNGNTYPVTYDTGRFVFVGLNVKL
ncbi:TonB-dependent receptor-like protein [Litorimonas taeanensis]|uniref:TonB-dependent receptor-like protein n=1 Tax=Litorimonas taeanensis TaxID=568099 RepID=A0A420WJ35_9PROT|nr:TonB-dependent receptor [Litorimonas taeanensis]RKQ71008.1 TonB-dependent receptor-like protein [Litorimonas taeanensis]